MDEIWMRFIQNMVDRTTGTMHFRLLLQPAMAAFFAVRSGLLDAKAGKPPYFMAMLHDPEHRADMLKDGWKSVGKIFLLALALDIVYQVIVLRFVYIFEAITVALFLAFVPYLLIRGPVTLLARKK